MERTALLRAGRAEVPRHLRELRRGHLPVDARRPLPHRQPGPGAHARLRVPRGADRAPPPTSRANATWTRSGARVAAARLEEQGVVQGFVSRAPPRGRQHGLGVRSTPAPCATRAATCSSYEGTTEDITERKRAEELQTSLRRNETHVGHGRAGGGRGPRGAQPAVRHLRQPGRVRGAGRRRAPSSPTLIGCCAPRWTAWPASCRICSTTASPLRGGARARSARPRDRARRSRRCASARGPRRVKVR